MKKVLLIIIILHHVKGKLVEIKKRLIMTMKKQIIRVPVVTKLERRDDVKLRNLIRNCEAYGLQTTYDNLRRDRGGD